MISELNLTRMSGESHAFMSLADFVSVASSRKGVLMQLVERLPDVLWALWRGTNIYQHALQMFDVAQQHVITSYLDAVWQNVAVNNTNATTLLFKDANAIEAVRRIVREHEKRMALLHVLSGGGSGRIVSRAAPEHDKSTATTITEPAKEETSPQPGRKLLESMSTIDTYTSLVASTRGFSDLAVASFKRSSDSGVPLVTETWLEGPFGWPPKYGTLAEAGQCPAVEQLIASTGEVLSVLKVYYTNDFANKVSVV